MNTTIGTRKESTLNKGAMLSSVLFSHFIFVGVFAGTNYIFWIGPQPGFCLGIYFLTTAFNYSFIN